MVQQLTAARRKRLFGNGKVRTGIDIGSTSVKLVCGTGRRRLERITHVGVEPYQATSAAERVDAAAEALKTLMKRLGLGKRRLGRVAVAVGWQETMVQEAITPPMDEADLARALPFEARKHMNLGDMADPVLAGQLLGDAGSEGPGGVAQAQVLLAAVPREARGFPLAVLARVGLEPEVVDLEPTAGLNELFANLDTDKHDGNVVGLVDLGGRHAAVHMVSRDGDLLSRNLGPGSSRNDDEATRDIYTRRLADKIQQTLTYYRGRYRREVKSLYVIGGGAYVDGRLEFLGESVGCPVTLLNPLEGLVEASGADEAVARGAELATACGLCRWGDDAHV